MEKILVDVGIQSSGRTFRLNPKSKQELANEFPHRNPISSIFVSDETKHDFENIHGSIYESILQILTDLPESKLKKIPFAIIDPVTHTELFNSEKPSVKKKQLIHR